MSFTFLSSRLLLPFYWFIGLLELGMLIFAEIGAYNYYYCWLMRLSILLLPWPSYWDTLNELYYPWNPCPIIKLLKFYAVLLLAFNFTRIDLASSLKRCGIKLNRKLIKSLSFATSYNYSLFGYYRRVSMTYTEWKQHMLYFF